MRLVHMAAMAVRALGRYIVAQLLASATRAAAAADRSSSHCCAADRHRPERSRVDCSGPALVVLGAFSVSTLRRAADNAIDCFRWRCSRWRCWPSGSTSAHGSPGVPPKMAASVVRLVPARRFCAHRCNDDRNCGHGRLDSPGAVASATAPKNALARAVFPLRAARRGMGRRRIDLCCSHRVLALLCVYGGRPGAQVKRVGGDTCVQGLICQWAFGRCWPITAV